MIKARRFNVLAIVMLGLARHVLGGAAETGQTAAPVFADDGQPMSLAQTSQKVSVPVGVYFSFVQPGKGGWPAVAKAGSTLPDLQVAVVPSVAVQGLRVQWLADPGVTIVSGSELINLQKADAGATYRRYLSVRRNGAAAAARLRVLVTVQVGGGSFMGIFVVPIDTTAAAAMKVQDAKRSPKKARF